MSSYGFRGFKSLAMRDAEFRIMILVATTLWIFTSISKLPLAVPSHYSDVGWLWIRDVYSGHHNLAIPYVDYELEYPQMIGLLIYVGQAISTYFPVVIDAYNTFVAVEALLEFPFMLGTIYNLYMLCQKLNLSKNRIMLYMLSTLTFIVYGFYNWDIVVAYFASLTIWLYLDKRFDASALSLTASVLTKFIPAVMFPAMIVGLPDNRARLRFTAILLASWSLVNAPFALAPNSKWYLLFFGTSGPVHQLQNTWISMVISITGLGDIISGARAGWILSFGIILFLVIRAIRSKKTPLEMILLSWYAWYGAIYLFDPQMVVQLFPIVILTPDFNFFFYRLADVLNAFIIIFYFIGSSHPELPRYITDQLTPFGLTNIEASIRQLIFLAGYFVCFNPKLQVRLKNFSKVLKSLLPRRAKQKVKATAPRSRRSA